MKRLLIALLFLMPLSASAEHENIDAPQVFWAHKPIQCGKPNEIIKIPINKAVDHLLSELTK